MLKDRLIEEMKAAFGDLPFWSDHTLRVLGHAEDIADGECLSYGQKEIISATAILHDIGAVEAQRKYGSTSREYQEQEGPATARVLLRRCGYSDDVIERVCFIVGHHHTPSAIDGIDFQVQWEADLLENLKRRLPEMTRQEISDAVAENFKTNTGVALARKTLLGG